MHTLTPFEAGKNAKELGVDVTKPFISRKEKRKVTFSQEQIEAIKKWVGPYTLKMSDEEGRSFYEWLKDHGV